MSKQCPWQKKTTSFNPMQVSHATSETQSISARNAVKHGCCALDTLILPSENRADFQSLQSAWRQTYAPQDETEHHLIDQLIAADWLLQRSVRTLAGIEHQIFTEEPNPLNWTDQHHQTLTRFQRYRTANQNAFNKYRKVIEDHRKTRAAETLSEKKQVMADERHAAFKRKNKPEPTFEESVNLMRRQAIALGFRQPDPPTP